MRYQQEADLMICDAEIELSTQLFAAQHGDERAFEVIYRVLNPSLRHFAASQCNGSTLDFEEVVSETWISAAKDLSKFNGNFSEFRSWIYAILRNRIIDSSRVRDRHIKSVGDIYDFNIEADSPAIESIMESDEAVSKIVERIKRLPGAQSEVVMLRIVADLSVEETARITHKSQNSVRVLCHRGLATLREELF